MHKQCHNIAERVARPTQDVLSNLTLRGHYKVVLHLCADTNILCSLLIKIDLQHRACPTRYVALMVKHNVIIVLVLPDTWRLW